MAIPNFFKQNKPRGFNYTPRFYDQKKEEREARNMMSGEHRAESGTSFAKATEDKHTERGGQSTGIPYRSKIMRGSMKNYFPRNKERVERHNMIRLVVIILILILLSYFFLRF